MNIDRNNYEMYFLLYVDNELSAEQRGAVEKFVAENIDLKAELESLMQTALPAEDVVFNAKDILYKKELTPGSLQEQMLLQLDDELDPLVLNSLSAAIASNDDLKREWNILQQTKLDPNEKIVFTDKKSLYRHEKDNVVSIYFWRVAAAILIIGLAVFIGVSKFATGTITKDVAGTNNNQQPSKGNIQPVQTTSPTQENIASVQPDTNDATNANNQDLPGTNIGSASQNDKNVSQANKETGDKQNRDNNNVAAIDKKNHGKEIVKKESNNLPKPYFENINNQDGNKIASSSVQDNRKAFQNKNEREPVDEKMIAKAGIKEPGKVIEDKEITVMDNSYAKNAVVDEAGSETNNNSILFISEEKVNRSKFGGVFKKVKRVLARNANINSGKNVKIAGFEIATR